ncbi:hypothetical protein BDB01DRAFT_778423 [Pilobolus umbonatus]|nr:hypothetical protein BDB01DRAFT_778423 [Pilobolus umbonatus]
MGNQTSRLERYPSSMNEDPCLENMRQLHNKKNDPYERQYPLPTIADDDNRIKPRKHSSPAAVNSGVVSRKPFYKFFKNLPRNNSSATVTQLSTDNTINSMNHSNCSSSSSLHSPSLQPIHPLAAPLPNGLYDTPTAYEDIQDTVDDSNQVNQHPLHVKFHIPPHPHSLISELDCEDYVIRRKRKYHLVADSTYILPCDDEEIDRLHLQHFMVRFTIQGNYLAPVNDILRKGGRVLDVGCGPGSWSMEIAGEYPRSTVIGIDMTPMFPREIKPANCSFYQCNIMNPLPFEDSSFDYIFMRFMAQSMEAHRWSTILNELIRILKPDGWIEWVEADIEIHRPGPMTHEINQHLINSMLNNKLDPFIARSLKDKLMETNKLSRASSMFVSCPGGQWAGKLGQLTIQSWKAYYQALLPFLCESWDINEVEYNNKLKSCWREADGYKTFENVHFAYGQKKTLPAIAS